MLWELFFLWGGGGGHSTFHGGNYAGGGGEMRVFIGGGGGGGCSLLLPFAEGLLTHTSKQYAHYISYLQTMTSVPRPTTASICVSTPMVLSLASVGQGTS